MYTEVHQHLWSHHVLGGLFLLFTDLCLPTMHNFQTFRMVRCCCRSSSASSQLLISNVEHTNLPGTALMLKKLVLPYLVSTVCESQKSKLEWVVNSTLIVMDARTLLTVDCKLMYETLLVVGETWSLVRVSGLTVSIVSRAKNWISSTRRAWYLSMASVFSSHCERAEIK